jgi:hypothetical protein
MRMFVLGLTSGFYSAQGLVPYLRAPHHYFLGDGSSPRRPPPGPLLLGYGWYWTDGGAGAYIVTRH